VLRCACRLTSVEADRATGIIVRRLAACIFVYTAARLACFRRGSLTSGVRPRHDYRNERVPQIATFDTAFPPERATAVAAALKAAGWDPAAEGLLNLTLLEDVLMIVDAAGGAHHVADYLRATARVEGAPTFPADHYLPLAEALIRASAVA
jgi:hypothetical protein